MFKVDHKEMLNTTARQSFIKPEQQSAPPPGKHPRKKPEGPSLTENVDMDEYRKTWTKNPESEQKRMQSESSKQFDNKFDRDAFVSEAIGLMRKKLKKRGPYDTKALGRTFRIMDDNKSGSLDKFEFKKALKEYGFVLTEFQLSVLYKHFDRDGSGSVDYDEFLRTVRGSLSERRLALVERAFAKMDKNKNGTIELADLRGTYKAEGNPKVVSGEMTEDEALAGFLANFEGSKNYADKRDGVITLDEWVDYYTDVSASCESDDYFEVMMTSAWKL